MRNKRLLIFLIALFTILIIACGRTLNEKIDHVSESKPETSTNESKFLVSKEPIELTFYYHYGNQFVYSDDLPAFKKAAELTNVNLKGTVSQNAINSDEIFKLMMASGEIPDIVHRHLTDINQLGPEGAFIPLNDLINEHAPNFKAFLKEYPEVEKQITATDGKIYAIPFVRASTHARAWFIRYDWLEKLGLDVPETTEDYYHVLKAFKTQDPNGNGQADEIPFAARKLTYFQDLFYLWGAHDDLFIDGNGQLKYGPMQEEYKDAMIHLNKWYKEGLIDPEIFTRGTNAYVELAANDQLGSAHDWVGSTAGLNTIYEDKIEDFSFKVFPPPTNTKGEKWEESRRSLLGVPGWAISYSNKYPVETIKYFDFWWSEEGRILMNFGIEGETYNMINGKPVFTDEVMKQDNVPTYLKTNYGVQYEIGFKQEIAYEMQWMHPIAKEGIQLYNENNYYIPDERALPPIKFTPEEQEQVNSIASSLNDYVVEKLQEWILTANPQQIEHDWESYTSQLIELGAEELVGLYREAYTRYLSE